ncbi:hypothetical protein AGOR_G00163090 [Albula goreensis]|uniref:Uncharacterized protein n=1 Tax=Albula goreensis TaxID=1534307 RepID=A0A8T3CVU8_9TELE|nr:hypothetical protein AGOR_G00163090 [Albula goreensis]
METLPLYSTNMHIIALRLLSPSYGVLRVWRRQGSGSKGHGKRNKQRLGEAGNNNTNRRNTTTQYLHPSQGSELTGWRIERTTHAPYFSSLSVLRAQGRGAQVARIICYTGGRAGEAARTTGAEILQNQWQASVGGSR